MKYLPWKDRKAVAADLTPIYQAATLAEWQDKTALEQLPVSF